MDRRKIKNHSVGDEARPMIESSVYFVRIGKHVKIGYSTNVEQRMKAFATSTTERIELLLTMPGGRKEEVRLHNLLAEGRIAREFFHLDYRLDYFIRTAEAGDVEKAWAWLEDSTAERRRHHAALARKSRVAAAAMKKAEIDRHCAVLVADRKRRLGW
jgi:Meiotically up-regulated gene 113